MSWKKKIALLLGICIVSTVLFGCSKENQEDGVSKIGIIQYVQHDALDQARIGFIEGLEEKGYIVGENIKLNYQNAQGDIATAQTISNQFVSDNMDMIFAIATQSVQSAYNATKDIPIIFTAVTDPVDAGVVENWESSGTNVTGTSDMVPMDEQLELFLSLVPDVKTMGVIYNSSEANSLIQVEELKNAAKGLNIEIKEITVTNVSEINQNLAAALSSIDSLYVPTDNTVASAYDLVGNMCVNKKVPVLCAEEAGVEKGGLCSIGIDYKQLGKEAAYKAAKVLDGEDISKISIDTLSEMKIKINKGVASYLEVNIPEEIEEKAEMFIGGEN